jgi:hypothetical protein
MHALRITDEEASPLGIVRLLRNILPNAALHFCLTDKH